MDEIYTVTGYAFGNFADSKTGRIVNYANLYCVRKIEGKQDANRKFCGAEAIKFQCVAPDVLVNVSPNDRVTLYFNKYKKVSMIQVQEPAK